MSTLAEATNVDLGDNYVQLAAGANPLVASNDNNFQPGASGYTRCPLPILSNSSDGLRTFYLGSKITQSRIYVSQNG